MREVESTCSAVMPTPPPSLLANTPAHRCHQASLSTHSSSYSSGQSGTGSAYSSAASGDADAKHAAASPTPQSLSQTSQRCHAPEVGVFDRRPPRAAHRRLSLPLTPILPGSPVSPQVMPRAAWPLGKRSSARLPPGAAAQEPLGPEVPAPARSQLLAAAHTQQKESTTRAQFRALSRGCQPAPRGLPDISEKAVLDAAALTPPPLQLQVTAPAPTQHEPRTAHTSTIGKENLSPDISQHGRCALISAMFLTSLKRTVMQ